MSQVTISGAVSGLDTASIINQLVAVQTNQQTLLRSQQSQVQKRSDAYAALATSLSSLGSLAADLARTSDWSGVTATSSSASVTATASRTAAASITFDVTSAAAAHALVTTSALTATTDLAASGPLTLTRSDGSVETIDVGTGSLADVVSAVNASGAGVTATAVRTAPGAYRLQVTADSTGAASEFTLDGLDGFDATAVLTQGADAVISIGGNPDTAFTVTSATNTFSDLVPGLSFTVSQPATGVTVRSTVDGSAVADTVSKLVDSANGILSDIAAKTAYSTTTRTGGPFTGENAVRSLQQNLLSAVSLSGAPGVSLTRDGRLAFDREAFLSAFAAGPDAVAQAFGAGSAFTPAAGVTGSSATVSSALKSARQGSYAVHVTSLAAHEEWQLDTGGSVSGQALTLTRGGTTLSYTAGAGEWLEDTVAALNARSAAAGFGVTASLDGNTLVLTADSAGTGAAFTAALDGAEGARVVEGADITGTLDGQTATGHGDVMSLPSGTGGAVGLSVAVTTTQDDLAVTGGDLGTVTFTPGLAQRLSTLIGDATGDTGSVQTAQDGADTQIKRFQKQIDDWDTRLTTYRQTLTLQFTAMETALAKLKTATAALSQLEAASSSSSSTSSG